MSASNGHRRMSMFRRLLHAMLAFAVVAPLVAVLSVIDVGVAVAQPNPCAPPVANKVACENTRPGTPDWQVGFTDESIAGFTTDISTTAGGRVDFKIDTDAASYRVDIFRLGWYDGDGARQLTSIPRSTPQNQPACIRDATGLADCGNWAVSVSWQVPADVVSGLYYARLHRPDTGAENEIAFVVRDDSSTSDILYQTSDATWQAYNRYGGASLYVGDGPGLDGSAFKVSYNRPLFEYGNENFIFNAEYPTLRFLERNGYDMSYTTNIDTARRGNLITNHDVFMAVGHDEYWSAGMRANVEAARDAGVHLAFLTGNEIFWKTRWEPSIAGTPTDMRTLVCYKESKVPQTDPHPTEWTGTWRDPRFSPPADGGRPENALLGNIFTVNGRRDDSLQVPAAYGKMRLWRNTALSTLSPGATYTFRPGTLGYEWNTVEDNGFQPPGVAQLSRTTVDLVGPFVLKNFGDLYESATKTHALTLYRHPSGSLVFGAGTVQWAWGLDDDHAFLTNTPTSDPAIQQATINFLADMGVRPSTVQPGLVATTASADTTAPVVAITAGPAPTVGTPYTVNGTVDDTVGEAAGVEVSTDSGGTWHPAVWQAGATTWSYTYTPASSGAVSLQARAVDDSANLSAPVSRPTTVAAPVCPCTIWSPSAVPTNTNTDDNGPVELGVKWRSSADGFVRGVRFHKGPNNTGTHTGSLWTTGGELLATGTFVNETATGWQTLTFPSPVPVTANTTYIASYHSPNGRYSSDVDYFKIRSAAQEPLTALQSSAADGANGVFKAGASGFPDRSFRDTNYWVDVLWAPDPGPDTRSPALRSVSPVNGAGTVSLTGPISAVLDEPINPASVQFTVTTGAGPASGTTAVSPDGRTVTFTPAAPLVAGSVHTATVAAADAAGNAVTPTVSWTFRTGSPRSAACPCTVWDDFERPAFDNSEETDPYELGAKVRFDGKGEVLGVRFYKGPANVGQHTGSFWNAAGQRLATGTFTAETASGWQTLLFDSPVQVAANTTYVVSYFAPAGRYAYTSRYFDNEARFGPIRMLQNGVEGGNGVYRPGGGFPTGTFVGANYWVDVIYKNGLNGDTTPPTVASSSPAPAATAVPVNQPLTATFSEPVDASSAQLSLTDPGGARLTGTPTLSADGRTLTWTPAGPLAPATTYGVSLMIADDNGVGMAAPLTWSFTTALSACPCSLFSTATVPTIMTEPDPGAQELGVKIVPSTSGKIAGVRFYKGPRNTGVHTGSLWNVGGQRLATGTFVDETATGWQTLMFDTPVTVLTGATYIASYSTTTGYYSADAGYFLRTSVDSPPLTSPSTNSDRPNGVYRTGAGFPTQSYQGGNYWVDVVYAPSQDTTVPTVTARTPAPNSTGLALDTPVSASFSEPVDLPSAQFVVADPGGARIGGIVAVSADQQTLTWTPAAPLAASTRYTVSVRAADVNGNAMPVVDSWSFTTLATRACPCTLFSTATIPTVESVDDPGALELGVRFTASVAGKITGVRFYKGARNTGEHTGSLWTSTGTRLATGTFTGESTTGWQTLAFATPISVQPGVTYVASYSTTVGYYSADSGYFERTAVNNPPLAASSTGPGTPNGVYRSGAGFPNATFGGGNFWVDVVFVEGADPGGDTTPPVLGTVTPAPGATGTSATGPVTATFDEPVDLPSAQFVVTDPGGAQLDGNLARSADGRTLTWTPAGRLAAATPYTATVRAADISGNAMPEPLGWTFTSTGTQTCPCTLFSPATVPTSVTVDDIVPLELGVRFTSTQAGTVTGVRFYKGPTNTGAHTGSLWSATGDLLATGTYTGETGSGWQTLTFATPVPVAAGVTYVASYTTTTGYSADSGYFERTGVNSPPLAASATGESTPNGVYRQGFGFPASTFRGGNFWVDVVFAGS